MYKELGLHGWQGVILADLGYTHVELGDYAEAQHLAQKGLGICQRLHYAEGIAWAATACGLVALGPGDVVGAESFIRGALQKKPDLRPVPNPDLLHALAGMALVWAAKGEKAWALSLARFVIDNTASWQWTKDTLIPLTEGPDPVFSSHEANASQKRYADESIEVVVGGILAQS